MSSWISFDDISESMIKEFVENNKALLPQVPLEEVLFVDFIKRLIQISSLAEDSSFWDYSYVGMSGKLTDKISYFYLTYKNYINRELLDFIIKLSPSLIARHINDFALDRERIKFGIEKGVVTLKTKDSMKNSSIFNEFEPDLVKKALSSDSANLSYQIRDVPKEYFTPEIIKDVLSRDGYCIAFMSDEVKDDDELVKIALTTSPGAFHYISDRLKNNRTYCLNAVKQESYNINYIPEEYRHDHEIMKLIVDAYLRGDFNSNY